MKAKRKPDPKGWMKIGDFSRLAGVPRSTIHFYANLGLLPPPDRRGPKLHLWGPPHRKRLREIEVLREQGGYKLAEIRQRLEPDRRLSEQARGWRGETGGDRDVRTRLLHVAARRFAEAGYHETRLEDVAAEVGLSKAAIYRHVASKEALFVECIGLIRHVLIPDAVRAVGERIDDPLEQAHLRVQAVLEHFPAYRKLTSLLGELALGEDPALAERARTELHTMVTNIQHELEEAMRAGFYRQGDAEFDAYVLWGAAMGLGDWLALRGGLDTREAVTRFIELTQLGTLPRTLSTAADPAPQAPRLQITDADGTTTLLAQARFDGEPTLALRRGRGTLTVDVHAVAEVTIQPSGDRCALTLLVRDGLTEQAFAPAALVVEGEVAGGHYAATLGDLVSLRPHLD